MLLLQSFPHQEKLLPYALLAIFSFDKFAGKFERNYVYERLPAKYFSKILHLIYQSSFYASNLLYLRVHNTNNTIFISRLNVALANSSSIIIFCKYVTMSLNVALHECTARKADDFEP